MKWDGAFPLFIDGRLVCDQVDFEDALDQQDDWSAPVTAMEALPIEFPQVRPTELPILLSDADPVAVDDAINEWMFNRYNHLAWLEELEVTDETSSAARSLAGAWANDGPGSDPVAQRLRELNCAIEETQTPIYWPGRLLDVAAQAESYWRRSDEE
jgi:hypothetical protein